MTGHNTDEHGGKSDMPQSYGPNLKSLIEGSKAFRVSRQDDADGPGSTTYHEPKPGKELDFN